MFFFFDSRDQGSISEKKNLSDPWICTAKLIRCWTSLIIKNLMEGAVTVTMSGPRHFHYSFEKHSHGLESMRTSIPASLSDQLTRIIYLLFRFYSHDTISRDGARLSRVIRAGNRRDCLNSNRYDCYHCINYVSWRLVWGWKIVCRIVNYYYIADELFNRGIQRRNTEGWNSGRRKYYPPKTASIYFFAARH